VDAALNFYISQGLSLRCLYGSDGVRVGMYERIKVRYLTFRSILDGQRQLFLITSRNSMNKYGRSTFRTGAGGVAPIFVTFLVLAAAAGQCEFIPAGGTCCVSR